MLKASYSRYLLDFKEPSGTSRGILTQKETWFIKITDLRNPHVSGFGECALFRGLSADDRPDYEAKLEEVCRNIDSLFPEFPNISHAAGLETLRKWSSIRFGVETALADLQNGGKRIIFPSAFPQGGGEIEINGLIWMGDKTTMQQRIEQKLKAGFRCIKLKIGAIGFQSELDLLKAIRSKFSRKDIELRVDANGAFTPAQAPFYLEQLARFDLHSVEQPIRQGQWEDMARLCRNTPIPIALDEELISIDTLKEKQLLLEHIRPQYIVLKPALTGGFSGAGEWISLARQQQTGWWVTSALESNIGLNAIAQWTFTLQNSMPQGLGTGQLYTNNIPSPLQQTGSSLSWNPDGQWEIPQNL